MKKYKQVIILVNLLIVLGLFARSIIQKEAILSDGKLLLLELAPVDPRSLIQGDYMNLRYKIAANIDQKNMAKKGFCVVKSDSNGIAERVRIQTELLPLKTGEYLIKYHIGKRIIRIGAESYFFQEGDAEKYAKAKYGGLKVDDKGNSILVGLWDEHRARIGLEE